MLLGTATWLNQTITLATKTGLSQSGRPTHGTPASISCAIGQQNKAVRTSAGDLIVSSTTILLSPSVSITVEDKITLPDGSTPLILSIEKIYHQGAHYATVVRT